MDPSGIAALLALAGIPVTLVVARWQKRTALEQAEASHRTALEVAEANHRAALEQAEANHRTALSVAEASRRSALEVVKETHRNELKSAHLLADIEQERLRRQVSQTTAVQFQGAIDRFRRAVLAEAVRTDELQDYYNDIHEFEHVLSMVASSEVRGHAFGIKRIAEEILLSAQDLALEARAELWRERVTPKRGQLDDAINQELRSPWPPRMSRQRPLA